MKALLKMLLTSREVTVLELQTKLDLAVDLYHSTLVVPHLSGPALWATRDAILFGPQKVSFFNLTPPLEGSHAVRSWGDRWSQMDAEIKYFFQ